MKFLENLAISILAVFAPIQSAIITVGVLVFADLIFGLSAAKKRADRITSSGIRRTLSKLAVYEGVLLLCFLGETYLLDGAIPAVKILCGLIAVTELKSILESANELNGGSLFKSLAERLGSDNEQEQRQQAKKLGKKKKKK
jgi:hypothetical protein